MNLNSCKAQVLTTEHPSEWRKALPATRSVFRSYEFSRIWERSQGFPAQLLLLEGDTGTVAYPFFQRPIGDMAAQAGVPQARWDTNTADYTGPLVIAGSAPADIGDVVSCAFRDMGVVAEFVHLNLTDEVLIPREFVHHNRDVVYVDLTVDHDVLWRDHFAHACRKNINRSVRENVRIFEARSADDIRKYQEIYFRTMDRAEALQRYYFKLDFFLGFFEEMRDHARFVMAEYQGKIIGAILYLHDDDTIYSYLGGADFEFQQIRPTNAIIYDTIRWGQKLGKKRLVLGGGYTLNDNIFRFKATFSPLTLPFHVAKRIHMPEEYAALCRAWQIAHNGEQPPEGYFPAYRS